jgi:hypothetical protein
LIAIEWALFCAVNKEKIPVAGVIDMVVPDLTEKILDAISEKRKSILKAFIKLET